MYCTRFISYCLHLLCVMRASERRYWSGAYIGHWGRIICSCRRQCVGPDGVDIAGAISILQILCIARKERKLCRCWSLHFEQPPTRKLCPPNRSFTKHEFNHTVRSATTSITAWKMLNFPYSRQTPIRCASKRAPRLKINENKSDSVHNRTAPTSWACATNSPNNKSYLRTIRWKVRTKETSKKKKNANRSVVSGEDRTRILAKMCN